MFNKLFTSWLDIIFKWDSWIVFNILRVTFRKLRISRQGHSGFNEILKEIERLEAILFPPWKQFRIEFKPAVKSCIIWGGMSKLCNLLYIVNQMEWNYQVGLKFGIRLALGVLMSSILGLMMRKDRTGLHLKQTPLCLSRLWVRPPDFSLPSEQGSTATIPLRSGTSESLTTGLSLCCDLHKWPMTHIVGPRLPGPSVLTRWDLLRLQLSAWRRVPFGFHKRAMEDLSFSG